MNFGALEDDLANNSNMEFDEEELKGFEQDLIDQMDSAMPRKVDEPQEQSTPKPANRKPPTSNKKPDRQPKKDRVAAHKRLFGPLKKPTADVDISITSTKKSQRSSRMGDRATPKRQLNELKEVKAGKEKTRILEDFIGARDSKTEFYNGSYQHCTDTISGSTALNSTAKKATLDPLPKHSKKKPKKKVSQMTDLNEEAKFGITGTSFQGNNDDLGIVDEPYRGPSNAKENMNSDLCGD